MDQKIWLAAAGLGIPGFVLIIFYQLYQKFDWPLAKMHPDKIFYALIVFMALIAVIVLVVIILWRPLPKSVQVPDGGLSTSIPGTWKFKPLIDTLAGKQLVEFVGFTPRELAAKVRAGHVTAPNSLGALRQIQILTDGRVRPYTVDESRSGHIVLRVKPPQ